MELLALACLKGGRIADWPRFHDHAVNGYLHLPETCQLNLGQDWLAGFERCCGEPPEFSPGQL